MDYKQSKFIIMIHLLQNKTAVFTVILLALTVSCAVPYTAEDPPVEHPKPDSLFVNVVFSVREHHSTKITGVTNENESDIVRWSIFAFEHGTGHFRYASSSSGSPLTLNLLANQRYSCHAIVNYPVSGTGAFDPSGVRVPGDIMDKTAYIGDCSAQSLPMFGSTYAIPRPGMEDNVTINVRRLVSRIDIRGLKVDFSGKPRLSGKTFILRSIYITNVYRTTRYEQDYMFTELSSTRSAWYNTGGWHRGETADTGIDSIVGDISINREVSADTPYNVTHSFYVFPNPTPLSQDIRTMEAWTRRCTRLVIEASLDSDIVYYAINVPDMERNQIYAASNVIIHGRGSNDPEIIDIDPDIITATVEPLIEDSWDGAGNVTLD